ncbi:hypothetical protein Q31b_52140 [Novipirellula aureliae]|uniref:Uncharacterized protein n=1 Tax=Novipirellula aureliae TaxID=2527966 RepID=A0A5C6DLJ0_9BACT|nr:hypothetical protein [Novipirellula aureliae]TWU35779.1 hypothetical protein Q31b_52140 [Novipirellula aureliae]
MPIANTEARAEKLNDGGEAIDVSLIARLLPQSTAIDWKSNAEPNQWVRAKSFHALILLIWLAQAISMPLEKGTPAGSLRHFGNYQNLQFFLICFSG